jgi:hypothetical protein
MRTLTTISALPSTKDEVDQYVVNVKREFIALSEPEKLEIWRQLKAFASVIKGIESDPDIKNGVLEAAQENGKSFEIKGARFTVKQMTKWDYSGCNDLTLLKYEKELKDIKDRISARQTMLQNLTGDVKDGDNLIHPPVKVLDEIISVTIK